MTLSKNKILTLVFSFVLLCCVPFVFSACGSGTEAYSQVVTEYSKLTQENPDVFNNEGAVEVKYTQVLENAILHDEFYSKLNHKTVTDGSKTYYALFEPVFVSSMTVFAYYLNRIDVSSLNISSSSAGQILSDFQNFKSRLSDFVEAKHVLEARDSLDTSNTIIQKELNTFCAAYKNLIDASTKLGQDYALAYQNEIFKNKDFDGKRYAVGEMKLTYLSKLNTFATLDNQINVAYYFDKKCKNQTNCESLLDAYNEIASQTLWDGTSSTVSDAEQQCINTYKSLLLYQPIFESQLNSVQFALKNIDLNEYFKFNSGEYEQNDFDAKTQTNSQKINQFLNTYSKNMQNYLLTLAQNIKNFKLS